MRDALDALTARWREEADVLARCGHESHAEDVRRRADEVETALRRRDRELLTVAEAATWSGYSEKRLREMVRNGKLPDRRPEGSQAHIKIPRSALPRKPLADRRPRDEGSPVDRLYQKARG